MSSYHVDLYRIWSDSRLGQADIRSALDTYLTSQLKSLIHLREPSHSLKPVKFKRYSKITQHSKWRSKEVPFEELLFRMYWVDLASIQDIARAFKVSPVTVSRWLTTFGIPTRFQGGGLWRIRTLLIRVLNRTGYSLMYWLRQPLSNPELAKILKVSRQTVWRYRKGLRCTPNWLVPCSLSEDEETSEEEDKASQEDHRKEGEAF